MSHWRDHAVPPMRDEALYGDRIVRCFAERPTGLAAMFARSCARRPDADAAMRSASPGASSPEGMRSASSSSNTIAFASHWPATYATPGRCSRMPTGTAIAPSRSPSMRPRRTQSGSRMFSSTVSSGTRPRSSGM